MNRNDGNFPPCSLANALSTFMAFLNLASRTAATLDIFSLLNDFLWLEVPFPVFLRLAAGSVPTEVVGDSAVDGAVDISILTLRLFRGRGSTRFTAIVAPRGNGGA